MKIQTPNLTRYIKRLAENIKWIKTVRSLNDKEHYLAIYINGHKANFIDVVTIDNDLEFVDNYICREDEDTFYNDKNIEFLKRWEFVA